VTKRLFGLALSAALAVGCVGEEPTVPTFSACASPLVECGTSCVDTSTDAQNCGACGTPCDVQKGEICAGGACMLACASGTTACGTSCVDTNADAAHCGNCTTVCDTAGGEVCAHGSCALACGGGTTACDGDCVNTDNDPDHCGDCTTACGDGQVCSAGSCGLTCAGGASLCDQSCVDFTSDPLHCGDCKTACDVKGGETCASGKCASPCAGGTTRCGDACVDTNIDAGHCGACDVTCGAHAACDGGACACNDGYTGDGQTCTDVDECAGDNDCSPSGECINTDGGYACRCRDGQTGDGKTCSGLELVTVASTGTGSAGLPSGIALSADGRYVAFVSNGQDLDGPTVGVTGPEAYVRDMVTGATTRASVNQDGAPADAPVDSAIAITPDGSRVAFASKADNLDSGNLNALAVFVRDAADNTTLWRSAAQGSTASNADSDEPALAADGDGIVFQSALKLTSTAIAGPAVYLSTKPSAAAVLVSVSNAGKAPAADTTCGSDARADAELPSISADGTRIVFDSIGIGLTTDTDANCAYDVFLRDLSDPKKPATSLLSANPDGHACTTMPNEAGSMDAVISADGNFVAFDSTCSDLLPTKDQFDFGDVFVKDLTTGALTKVSVSTTGGEANGNSFTPQISADGRYVAFTSYASNLVAGDTNLVQDVFVRDMASKKTMRVDLDADGQQIDDGADTFAFASNGGSVAFLVYQSLLPADTTGEGQIYLRSLR